MLNMKENIQEVSKEIETEKKDVEKKCQWKEEKITRSCLIDADFRGTGLEVSLLKTINEGNIKYLHKERNGEYKPFKIIENTKYYNDLLINQKKYVDEIFTKCEYKKEQENIDLNALPEDKKKKYEEERKKYIKDSSNEAKYYKYFAFDVCFCNPSNSSKNKFIPFNNGMNITLIIKSYFKHSFKEFLSFVEKKGYTDIVIDLPPSLDEYVYEIYNVMLNVVNGRQNKDHVVTLYLVTTFDKAHIYSNLEYLKDLITKYTFKNCFFDEIKIIINDINDDVHGFFNNNLNGNLFSNDFISKHKDSTEEIKKFIAIFDKYNTLIANNPHNLNIKMAYNPYCEEISKFVSVINPIYYTEDNKLEKLSDILFDCLINSDGTPNYNLLENFL